MRYAWLCHPVTVLAVLVLLVNDHVLKAAWPGLVTGKLSDVAGLVVAPPLLALLFRRRADLAAVLLTGVGFALVKTTPAGAELASQAWTLVWGPSRVLADPTDLLALPALALAWWARSHRLVVRPGFLRVLVVVPFAMLAVAATSATPPPPSATSVEIHGDAIVVFDLLGPVASTDGGRTWQPANLPAKDNAQTSACVPHHAQRCYRIVPDTMSVVQSDDFGASWRPSWAVPPGRVDLLERTVDDSLSSLALAVQARPGGAHVVVVANGRDGIAVRDESGHWRRVGPDYEGEAAALAQPGAQIGVELTIAVVAGLLTLATLITVLASLPGKGLHSRPVTLACGTAVAVALSIATPFYAWSSGLLPDYGAALVLAPCLSLLSAATGLIVVRRSTLEGRIT